MKSIVVLLTLLCLCQGQNHGCPPNWTRLRGTDRCYFISIGATTWDHAWRHCRSMDSQLAPPLTCEEQFDLNEFLVFHRETCQGEDCTAFWIGLKAHYYQSQTPISDPRTVRWWTTEGVPVKNDSLYQWWEKDPKMNGDCAVMSYEGNEKKGVWRTKQCNESLKYVCITCPNNFEYYAEINECLYFNTTKMKWNDARMACTKLKSGAQLLTIKTWEKKVVVTECMRRKYEHPEYAACFKGLSIAQANPIWSSGQTEHPKICGTPYVWKPVGAPEQPLEYLKWFPGSPNCGFKDENCLAVTTRQFEDRWEDMVCSEKLCSVCEF